MDQRTVDPAAIEAEVDRVRSLGIDALRQRWRMTFGNPAANGMVHSPSQKSPMSEESRDALLSSIAKARAWIEDLAEGRVTSFAEIAKKEGKVVRHIRLLAQLAFVSPKIVSAIETSTALEINVTALARAAVPARNRQQQSVEFSAYFSQSKNS